MIDILRLYYYEMEKNRKKFIIISVAVLIMIFSLSYIMLVDTFNYLSIPNNIKIFGEFSKHSSENIGLSELIKNYSKDRISIKTYIELGMEFYFALGTLISILMSFDIVMKNYRKKNQSYYIESMLPIGIWKTKIAKILCGYSLYVFFISTSLIGMMLLDKIMGMAFSDIYIADVCGKSFDNPFVPGEFLNNVLFMFAFVLTCIVGTQFLTSVLFTDYKRGSNYKRISFFILLPICIFLMTLLIIVLVFVPEYAVYTSKLSIKLIVLIILTFISGGMFVADVKITKKRLKGGL